MTNTFFEVLLSSQLIYE